MSNRVEIGKVRVSVCVEKGENRSVGKWRKMSSVAVYREGLRYGEERCRIVVWCGL